MAQENADKAVDLDPEKADLYQGNKIPKMLRWAYAAFAIWAATYVIKYLVPNLLVWLRS